MSSTLMNPSAISENLRTEPAGMSGIKIPNIFNGIKEFLTSKITVTSETTDVIDPATDNGVPFVTVDNQGANNSTGAGIRFHTRDSGGIPGVAAITAETQTLRKNDLVFYTDNAAGPVENMRLHAEGELTVNLDDAVSRTVLGDGQGGNNSRNIFGRNSVAADRPIVTVENANGETARFDGNGNTSLSGGHVEFPMGAIYMEEGPRQRNDSDLGIHYWTPNYPAGTGTYLLTIQVSNSANDPIGQGLYIIGQNTGGGATNYFIQDVNIAGGMASVAIDATTGQLAFTGSGTSTKWARPYILKLGINV